MQNDILNEMIQTRRQLHKRPEEGWTEFETTYLVVNRLKQLGFKQILTGLSVIDKKSVLGRDPAIIDREINRAIAHGVPAEFIDSIGALTGCVAILDTGRTGPVSAFRFDMDALLIQETSAPDHAPNREGFASERDGLMHACGHDSHTALGLALARWAKENEASLCGVIKFIFQPAEEGVRGAVAIANSGILDDVQYLLASHCGGPLKPQEVGLFRSGLLASTKFDIRFKGTPSHAGNQPHKGHSALMAACATSMMLTGIPRHGNGVSRVAVGRLVAGEGRNITPVNAYIQTEVRGETAEVNDFMCKAVENIVKGNALAYEVEGTIERVGDATTLIHCPEILDMVNDIAQNMPTVKGVVDLTRPSGSEDFTMMLKRVVDHGGRGGMFRWGCIHNGHHKADFDIQDTENMPIAFDIFIALLKKLNGY